MIDQGLDDVPFRGHVELLHLFVAHRAEIVESVEGLLNARRQPIEFLRDRALLSRLLEDCFYTLTGIGESPARLRGRLDEAHWASGFKPRQAPGLHNDLIDPAELMVRGFYCWQQTRWPGRDNRVRYAHTLFNSYLLRCLELLSMRLWDTGSGRPGDRLAQVQALLDELWQTAPDDQPVLVRDARWLIPLAQSPTTDELAAYFRVAERVAQTLPEADRIEIQRAHAVMIGGHLRSQIRHYCISDGVALNETSVVLRTRTSNALDFALVIQGLVSLLEAYEHALHAGDSRLRFANAICQSISPDPELFVNRIDLLGAYSMIEHLFIAADDDGRVDYTPVGKRHMRLLQRYEGLIDRLSKPLCEDCARFEPLNGSYSPYGAIYGTPSNLTEHMALKTLSRDAETRFCLEDVFTDGDASKLAWVNGWRQLPHIPRDVQKLHEYPQRFAEEIFERIAQALQRGAAPEASTVAQTGRLFIGSAGDLPPNSTAASIPDLPVRYIGSSDGEMVAEDRAESYDEAQLLRDRLEGHFALSYATPGGWVAIKKNFLTEVLGAGRDVKIVGLPSAAADTLRLMCPSLVGS